MGNELGFGVEIGGRRNAVSLGPDVGADTQRVKERLRSMILWIEKQEYQHYGGNQTELDRQTREKMKQHYGD